MIAAPMCSCTNVAPMGIACTDFQRKRSLQTWQTILRASGAVKLQMKSSFASSLARPRWNRWQSQIGWVRHGLVSHFFESLDTSTGYVHPIFLGTWFALAIVMVRYMNWWPSEGHGALRFLSPVPAFAAMAVPLMFFVDWYESRIWLILSNTGSEGSTGAILKTMLKQFSVDQMPLTLQDIIPIPRVLGFG
jgi:hypothetical protein